jgi:hypothetical protein
VLKADRLWRHISSVEAFKEDRAEGFMRCETAADVFYLTGSDGMIESVVVGLGDFKGDESGATARTEFPVRQKERYCLRVGPERG